MTGPGSAPLLGAPAPARGPGPGASRGWRDPRFTIGACGVALATAATWLRFGWERTLRLDTGTIPFLASAFVVGVGLAVAGTSALRLERDAGPVTRAQLGWAVALQLLAFPALALTSLDLFSNVAYGHLQVVGRNPYLEGPHGLAPGPLLSLVSPRWIDTPSAYGPVISLVSRAAATAGAAAGSVLWGGGAAFKLAMTACAVATVVLAWALLRRDGEDGASRFALLAFAPILAWEVSAQGHNDGLLVLSLMLFVWAARTGQEWLATVALTLGALSKLPAVPLLAIQLALALRSSWRRAAGHAAVSGALAAALVAPYWRGLATFRGTGIAAGGDAARHAHSLADLLALLLDPVWPAGAVAAYWACWVASIALCVFLFLRALTRATTVERVVHDGLVLFLAYCLTTAWFQPWYATWLLPLAITERNAQLRRVVALYATLTVVQWGLPLDPFSTVAVNGWIAVLAWRALRGRQGSSQGGWARTGVAPVT